MSRNSETAVNTMTPVPTVLGARVNLELYWAHPHMHQIYNTIPVLGLKEFLHKSATDGKGWALKQHIILQWRLKERNRPLRHTQVWGLHQAGGFRMPAKFCLP